ncbi:DUF1876 family protein [Kitasatospora atroaurantiaca]|uniref:Uncharacterized protein DUF1876 n=1 Tax=Kitasatospora atroaurantiaca TaxID=285545 RepID=A0A561EL59_9ACTN|nr:DUF1876 domain-containing protein [Kitasatospora atroaurantiaca]TWE16357.1 uncharacterized protein DUF1876 [Kitasatospora atroaurantiaca]
MHNHWIIDLNFEEDENRTACTATLNGFSAPGVKGVGIARRNPDDSPDSTIGEELAAARACSNLAHELINKAASGIETRTHEAAHLIF